MSGMSSCFDAIVIGAGHAGCEAAHVLARRGAKTLLVTITLNKVATLPCNPSMGGPAKGVIIKEVDAMGGLIGFLSDQCSLQTRLLNNSKGPAVWALRMQIDKNLYSQKMLAHLKATKNLTLYEGIVDELLVEDSKVIGIKLMNNEVFYSKVVIITTGTYLNSRILIGENIQVSGPDGDKTSFGLSKQLATLGFDVIRLKTGTPPRLLTSSINFNLVIKQSELNNNLFFSALTNTPNQLPKIDCFLTKTTLATKEIILKNIALSPLYQGVIQGLGPRYCPSIEDKIMRFREKDMHQIFLEPETNDFYLTYPQGLSSSLPRFVQRKVVSSCVGLSNTVIKKYGYAIEYDAVNPLNLKASLETKIIANLFCAGQINGTSGYEEAAGQGFIAGLNASLKLRGEEPLILKRYEAYIGVLIDDIVTKGTKEPYRMLTSSAEHRLILRMDNALLRLRPYAIKYHTISLQEKKAFNNYLLLIEQLTTFFNTTLLKPSDINHRIKALGLMPIINTISLAEFIRRPEINCDIITSLFSLPYPQEVIEEVLIQTKYAGYIEKEYQLITKIKELENTYLGSDFNYELVNNLSLEGKEKLLYHKPDTLGQASRILGVKPSDISILMIYLRAIKK